MVIMKISMNSVWFAVSIVSVTVSVLADDSPFGDVSIGTLKEKGEKAGIAASAKLLRDIPESFSGGLSHFAFIGKPSFDITATDDGLFDNTNLGLDLVGMSNPDIGIFIAHTGVEFARNFDEYAGLVELGWVYGRRPKDSRGGILMNAMVSEAPLIAIQGGYKFAVSTNDPSSRETQQSKNEESEDSLLARVKLEAGLSMVEVNRMVAWSRERGAEMGWLGTVADWLNNPILSINPGVRGRMWVDIANDEVYHQETVSVEIGSNWLADTYLGRMIFKKGKIDLSYNWGSGAPLFNRGEYFSAALKMEL